MRSRHNPQCAILLSKIVKHPDCVANPITPLVCDSTHVGVQGLQGIGLRVCGAGIEAAQLKVGSQDGSDEGKDLGKADDTLKYLSFRHQVGETSRSGLQPELRSRMFSLMLEQLFYPVA